MIKIGKVFKKKESDRKSIRFLLYDQSQDHDYYSFVRDKRDLDYHQVIITSEMMIDILDYYFMARHASISSIELMESDAQLEQKIQEILLKMDVDRAYYSKLITLLNFIKEKFSIDLKKINIKNKNEDDQFRLYVKVNGLVGIDEIVYDKETNMIGLLLERCINI